MRLVGRWLGFLGGYFLSSLFCTMATEEVTGKTPSEVEERRREFLESNKAEWYEFEDWYCLCKIPRQPEDYDGPPRYCFKTELDHDSKICKFHGGAGHGNPENLDPLANMKHGMKATRENLVKDFSEADQALYEWITEEWPGAYDIDTSGDPQAEYEFHALAVEIVRAERAEGYIIEEGESGEKRVFSPSGEMFFDQIPHYLVDMLQRQRKLIMKMEDNLGISRKKRLANEQAQDATEVMQSFAEVGASLITDADQEYDPERFGGPDG